MGTGLVSWSLVRCAEESGVGIGDEGDQAVWEGLGVYDGFVDLWM